MTKRVRWDPEALRRMYVTLRKSDREIGAELGVTDVAVGLARKRFGIETVRESDRRVLEGLPSLRTATREELSTLVSSEKTLPEIAAYYGVSEFPLKARLRELGVRAPTAEDRLGAEIPEAVLRVVYGTLLGDGSIGYERSGTSSRFSLGHSHRQYGYLRSLAGKMGEWAGRVRVEFSPGSVFYSFSSPYHPAFRRIREQWYRDDLRGTVPTASLKSPPLDVLRTLSDESLAYWYFDDGTRDARDGSVSIVTYFPLLDGEAFLSAVREGTGLGWTLASLSRTSPALRNLRLPASDREQFFRRIVPFATPDLASKFPPAFRESIGGAYELPPDIGERSVERLAHYRPDAWRKLSAEAREREVREIVSIYRVIGFPFAPVPPPEVGERAFRRFREYREPLVAGSRFTLDSRPAQLANGFMNHRYRAKVGGRSAFETFEDDEAFRAVVRSQLSSPSSTSVVPDRMRAALSVYGGNRTPSNFRPRVAKALCDAFVPPGGAAWDPCAGFGGRLLGAVASSESLRYYATEPSPETVEGLRRLWAYVAPWAGGAFDRVQILPGTAEESSISPESIDLVFTSPPYWTRERYVGGAQSHARYPVYEDWTERFLRVLIRKAYEALKDGGRFALNIANLRDGKRTYPLVPDADRIAREEGFRRELLLHYPLKRMGRERPDEPVLVYRKGSVAQEEPEWIGLAPALPPAPVPRVETPRTTACADCGEKILGRPYRGRRCARCRKAPAPPSPGRPREKTCAYRNCGKGFVDGSRMNGKRFCTEECRRREKLFRSGKVDSESRFRVRSS